LNLILNNLLTIYKCYTIFCANPFNNIIILYRYPLKYGQNSISSTKLQSGNYYTKDKTEDFKVFHTIPASSHLLANYDPFYSPLLSRIDTVFKQLGYTTEPCRERLVCQMYRNPAKFAPYSNLISAQLSRLVIKIQVVRSNAYNRLLYDI
jgi:hypothetical protein